LQGNLRPEEATERDAEVSGVIDKDGKQWERCGRCAGFTAFDDLCYETPSEQFEFGRDLCPSCYHAVCCGLPLTLPKEQWKDQLSTEEAQRIRDEVSAGIKKHGLKVLTYNADGTVTDDSIPPEEDAE
jgi:hypothetical protein